jgi:hypothetical protein
MYLSTYLFTCLSVRLSAVAAKETNNKQLAAEDTDVAQQKAMCTETSKPVTTLLSRKKNIYLERRDVLFIRTVTYLDFQPSFVRSQLSSC